MVRVYLSAKLSEHVLSILSQSFLGHINNPFAQMITNSQVYIYFDREKYSEFLDKCTADGIESHAISAFGGSKFRLIPKGQAHQPYSFLENHKEIFFCLGMEGDLPRYVVNPYDTGDLSKKVMELCSNGRCSWSWLYNSHNEVNDFIDYLIGTKTAFDYLMVAERHPSWDRCEIVKKAFNTNARKKIFVYFDSRNPPDDSLVARFKKAGRHFIAVHNKEMLHERCLWFNDGYFHLDNSLHAICGTNQSWTVDFTIDVESRTKSESKFRQHSYQALEAAAIQREATPRHLR